MSNYEYKNPRYAARISKEDLKKKIEKAYKKSESYRDLTPSIIFDLNKVDFDTENIDILGYFTTDWGFTYFAFTAGGDWEYPVYIILYFDGKKLRGYIPNEGNLWNQTTKSAYGNNDDADLKDVKRRWPDLTGKDIDSFDLTHDNKKILEDIKSRIKLREL